MLEIVSESFLISTAIIALPAAIDLATEAMNAVPVGEPVCHVSL